MHAVPSAETFTEAVFGELGILLVGQHMHGARSPQREGRPAGCPCSDHPL